MPTVDDGMGKEFFQIIMFVCFRLGSDPEKLFPFGALLEQLRKFGKFGLLNATFILPVITKEVDMQLRENFKPRAENLKDEIEVKLESDSEDELDFDIGRNISDSYKKRFRDIVSDMYRLGYI